MRYNYTPVLFLLAVLLSASTASFAQDPRFSQYYASPWNLNPAMTGVFSGKWRVTANYRDQWGSILGDTPFRTYSAAADLRVNVGGGDDYAAFGIGAMHDEAGVARYAQNKAHLGGGFIKQLSGGRYQAEHYLSAGAQLGFGQNSVDWSRLWFTRQFDNVNEIPDGNLSNGEPSMNANSGVYLDFNAGLLWYVLFGEGGFFYAGGAMHHLNSPNIALTDNGNETLYSRWSGHVGGQLPVTENFSLLPGALVMKQGPAFETDFGLNLRYSNNDYNELALRAGAWARLGNRLDKGIQADAVTIVGMLELERWMLGLSYDITVSSLAGANNSRGAFEVSLTYFHPEYRRGRVECPRF
ncbi:MAG: PorP/SprF family type IX secretion system membrane protein [Saprospiraceae bacterium]|nr:PorP/SprF family type IX secretion system membrane protein [Saprospiraceae bacterium]